MLRLPPLAEPVVIVSLGNRALAVVALLVMVAKHLELVTHQHLSPAPSQSSSDATGRVSKRCGDYREASTG